MATYTPEELDRQAAERHSERFTPPTPHPASVEALAEFDRIVEAERTSLSSAAFARKIPTKDVTDALAQARANAKQVEQAYAKVRQVPPSDRQHYREIADSLAERLDVAGYHKRAVAAVEALATKANEGAIPPKPQDSADAKEELRMMLDSRQTKDGIEKLATEERYAAIICGPWGRSYFRAKGQPPEYHAALVAHVAQHFGDGASTDLVTKARRFIAASSNTDIHRLQVARGETR